MQAVGKANLPGKQILDTYPFLQDLPEFLTPYKAKSRAVGEEGDKFWAGLAEQVADRMKAGTAAPGFTRDLLSRRETMGINDGEFGLLTGGSEWFLAGLSLVSFADEIATSFWSWRRDYCWDHGGVRTCDGLFPRSSTQGARRAGSRGWFTPLADVGGRGAREFSLLYHKP